MSTHVLYIESHGDLIDVEYFCGPICLNSHLVSVGKLQRFDTSSGKHSFDPNLQWTWGNHPAPSWPDYEVECCWCGEVLHAAYDSEWDSCGLCGGYHAATGLETPVCAKDD